MRSTAYQEPLRFLSVGRNYNFKHILLSQRAQLIDATAISLCGQVYVGRMHEQNDLSKMRNWLKEKTENLPSLQVGEFYYVLQGESIKFKAPLFKSATKPTLAPIKSIACSRARKSKI
ncbi:MAG: hypothetical protein OEX77_09215 [Candidatus Bathyarchaeota archaeon]|nr:hypothetical protein [Candidatus Bathyarchaeota archaeon]